MFEKVNKTGLEWWLRNFHAKQLEVKTIHEKDGYLQNESCGGAESTEKT